jgi:phosphoribosylformylglycinamidine (FGAM) synthase-like amidotransferase family enzyme
LLRNNNQQFIGKNIFIKEAAAKDSAALKIPIAHGEGRYFADDKTLEQLKINNQVIYHYCDEKGNITETSNPNGAIHNIAGICNEKRNVFGMMPHPERASNTTLGNEDGKKVFAHLFGIN